MKIEFVIPTYNRPHQLMGVISSIFSQTSPDWKIHVVADGIYDGYQKVKDYFYGDERIKFTELNIGIKRPGNGMSPLMWNKIVGNISNKNYEKDEMIFE